MGWMGNQGYRQVFGHSFTKSYIRGGQTTKDIDGYLVMNLTKSYLRDGRTTEDIDKYLVARIFYKVLSSGRT